MTDCLDDLAQREIVVGDLRCRSWIFWFGAAGVIVRQAHEYQVGKAALFLEIF